MFLGLFASFNFRRAGLVSLPSCRKEVVILFDDQRSESPPAVNSEPRRLPYLHLGDAFRNVWKQTVPPMVWVLAEHQRLVAFHDCGRWIGVLNDDYLRVGWQVL